MILSLAAALALSTLATDHTSVAGPEPVTLAYTFEGLGAYNYTRSNSQTQLQSMFGQNTTTTSLTTAIFSRELVETLDDGNRVVAEQNELRTYSESLQQGDFDFDASKPEDESKRTDPRVAAELASTDWTIHYIMNPQGEILGIHNTDEINEKIAAVKDAELGAQLAKTHEEEALINEQDLFTHLLPAVPVAEGDQWSRTITVAEGPMSTSIVQTMTVESIIEWKEGHRVVVLIEGDVSLSLPADFPDFMKITQNTFTGRFIFNTHVGAITEYSSDMTLVMAGSPNPSMGEVSVTNKMHSEYELDLLLD